MQALKYVLVGRRKEKREVQRGEIPPFFPPLPIPPQLILMYLEMKYTAWLSVPSGRVDASLYL